MEVFGILSLGRIIKGSFCWRSIVLVLFFVCDRFGGLSSFFCLCLFIGLVEVLVVLFWGVEFLVV